MPLTFPDYFPLVINKKIKTKLDFRSFYSFKNIKIAQIKQQNISLKKATTKKIN